MRRAGLVVVVVLGLLSFVYLARWRPPREVTSGVALTYVCTAPVARHDADKIDKRLSHLEFDATASAIDATHMVVRIGGDGGTVIAVRALLAPHHLELRPVDEAAMRALAAMPLPPGVSAGTTTQAEIDASTDVAFSALTAPAGTTIVTGCDGPGECHAWAVGASGLERSGVSRAEVSAADATDPAVLVTLTPNGADRFAALASRIAGGRSVIVFDGHVLTAPVVREPIHGGHVRITLGADATRGQAEALALVLPTDHTECPAWRLESQGTFGPETL